MLAVGLLLSLLDVAVITSIPGSMSIPGRTGPDRYYGTVLVQCTCTNTSISTGI